MMTAFSLTSVPELRFGEGRLAEAGKAAATWGGNGAAVLVVADPILKSLGHTSRLSDSLAAAGLRTELYEGLAGEPKSADIDAATTLARKAEAKVVIGLGGGSALDTAKLVACCAASGLPASAYELCATPLPANRLPLIAIPTTAGTGSEVTRTSVFANAAKQKVWAWGNELKPDLAILDPALTTAVPAAVTAATGLDALVHAIEAATNRHHNPGSDIYAHRAIALISANLEKAVATPGDVAARGALLLGSCLAGIAFDNTGTALAHNISHAVADLAPIAHGRATGLAMMATIDWVEEGDREAFSNVARAMAADDVVAAYRRLVKATGIKISLAGDGLDLGKPELLAARMAAPANTPMRKSTKRYPSDEDLLMLARRYYALGQE
ncbi:MAG: iron-containing alcohol dehydrogenase [Alphaproteobacteria bacterium]|nr:iron-containing alcohol dehydrogenase [Alphaproteobacteria bacterium]